MFDREESKRQTPNKKINNALIKTSELILAEYPFQYNDFKLDHLWNYTTQPNLLKIISLSGDCHGLVVGKKWIHSFNHGNDEYDNVHQDVHSIVIVEGKNSTPKCTLTIPSKIDIEYENIIIKQFPQNNNFFALCAKKICWVVDSTKNRWLCIKKCDDNSVLSSMTINHQGDLLIVKSNHKTHEYKLEKFAINLKTLKSELIDKYLIENYSTLFNTQTEMTLSPVSSHHGIIANQRGAILWRFDQNKIKCLTLPNDKISIRQLHWLPDGSLLAINDNLSAEQWILTNADKIHVQPLGIEFFQRMSLNNEDTLIIYSRNHNSYLQTTYKISNLANNKLPLCGIAKKVQAEMENVFPTTIARMVAEYACDEVKTLKTHQISVPVRADMSSELRQQIENLYTNLEKKILAHQHSRFKWLHSLEDDIQKKMALDYFIGLLHESNKSLSACKEEVMKSSFSQHMEKLIPKIPALLPETKSQPIQEKIPKSSKSIFFMTQHYSTAEKIIFQLQDRITNLVHKEPWFIRLNKDSSVVSIAITLKNKSTLARVLGDLLKEILPNPIYIKYQTLDSSEKLRIRNLILNDYFKLIQNSIQNLRNLMVIDTFSDKWGDIVKIKCSLPALFIDKDKLAVHMYSSIIRMQNEILSSGNELIQLHNKL